MDETTTETQVTTETTIETAPPATNVKTFTQDEVNRMTARARDEGRKSAMKAQQPVTPPAPAADDEKLTMKEQLALMQLQLQFTELAGEHQIPKAAKGLLLAAFKAEKPADPSAWFETNAKLFGNGTMTTIETKPAPTAPAPAPAEPAKPPAAAPTAPAIVNPHTSGGLVNIFSLTEAQLAQMSHAELRGHFEKILDHGRSVSGAPTRPVPGAPRK